MSDDLTLALTTDSIAEQISFGLYADPYLIGWMTAMGNLSDLAAVGANPLGLLIAKILPPDCDDEFLVMLQRGIQEGCDACGTFVHGGDSNKGPQLVLTGTAVGVFSNRKWLSRIGIRSGEWIYSTG
jgi:thiamine-monophosphate kinase